MTAAQSAGFAPPASKSPETQRVLPVSAQDATALREQAALEQRPSQPRSLDKQAIPITLVGLRDDPRGGTNLNDLAIGVAWPVLVLVVCWVFRRGIRQTLEAFAELIPRLKELGIGPLRFRTSLLKVDSLAISTVSVQQSKLLPPKEETLPELKADALELLCTLWTYQRSHLGADLSRRWSFIMSPTIPRYGNYLRGLADAYQAGLVAVDPKTLQCYLTDPGVEYCKRNEAKLSGDFWQQ